LQTYQSQTWPVAETLKGRGVAVEAIECGELDPEGVAERIVSRLERVAGKLEKLSSKGNSGSR
jgi:hypothetical protein